MFAEDYKWHYDYVRLARDTGFTFEKHKSEIFDKNKISLVDIDRIIEERDFATIETFIPTITKFVLDSEQTHVLDVSFVKTFRLSQLALQYLLYCKKYLDNSLELVKTSIKKVEEENKELKLFVDDLKEHISNLMREIDEKNSYKCEQCTKMFSTPEFLSSHIKRRHEIPEADKLQTEIKELKGRLNSAEQLIHKEQKHEIELNESRKIEELQQKFEELRLQVQSELKILQNQFSFQEKYDKLVEKMALQGPSGGDLGYQRRESATQTDVAVVLQTSPKFGQLDKENIPESGVSHFEEALETKVSTSLDKIERQMQAFWNKLSEIENRKKSDKKQSSERKIRTSRNYVREEEKKEIEAQKTVDAVQETSKVEENVDRIESGIQMSEEQETTISETVATKSNSSEESLKSDPKPVPAPRKRSIPSLPLIDEQLLRYYRSEIEKQVRERLQDLGVSPDWTILPTRSFQRALEIVNHQANLTKKNYPNFDFIASQIVKNIDMKLQNSKKIDSKKDKGKITKIRNPKRNPSSRVEIKNRKMYETDSESEIRPIRVTERPKQFSVPYSAVIEELKAVNTIKSGVEKNEEQTKGVLKSYPSVGSLTKKKVLFNLDTDHEDLSGKNEESSTSIASSVLDGTPRTNQNKPTKKDKDIENLSDFDFSDM